MQRLPIVVSAVFLAIGVVAPAPALAKADPATMQRVENCRAIFVPASKTRNMYHDLDALQQYLRCTTKAFDPLVDFFAKQKKNLNAYKKDAGAKSEKLKLSCLSRRYVRDYRRKILAQLDRVRENMLIVPDTVRAVTHVRKTHVAEAWTQGRLGMKLEFWLRQVDESNTRWSEGAARYTKTADSVPPLMKEIEQTVVVLPLCDRMKEQRAESGTGAAAGCQAILGSWSAYLTGARDPFATVTVRKDQTMAVVFFSGQTLGGKWRCTDAKSRKFELSFGDDPFSPWTLTPEGRRIDGPKVHMTRR